MKKRIAALLFVVLLMGMLMSACGKQDLTNSKYVGTWELDSISMMGESGEFDEAFTIVLNGDGTAIYDGDDGPMNCTWEETSNGLKLKGDMKLTFTDDGDGIVTKFLGAELHFVKK